MEVFRLEVARARPGPEQLCSIVNAYGTSIAEEPRRCEALLRDLCGDQKPEVAPLVVAAKDGVPVQILAASESVPTRAVLQRLARRLTGGPCVVEGGSDLGCRLVGRSTGEVGSAHGRASTKGSEALADEGAEAVD